MWNWFKNWVKWLVHPLPNELKTFRQLVSIKNKQWVLAAAQYKDVSEIMVVERAAYFGAEPWSANNFHMELNRPHERLYVVLRDPESQKLVAYIGAAYRVGIHEVHITNVAVAPEYQSQGIGTFLISYMMTVAAQIKFHRISLEVRVSNQAAIRLYERLGFQLIRRKKHYYGDDGEDAFDMAQLLGEKKQYDKILFSNADIS